MPLASFFVFTVSFCLGIIAGSMIAPFFTVPFFILTACLLSKHKRIVLVGIASAGIVVGMFRLNVATYVPIETIERRVGQTVRIEGVVSTAPDVRDSSVGFVVTPIDATGRLLKKEKIEVRLFEESSITYADRVLLEGTLVRPEVIVDGVRRFNYPEYLAIRGVRYQMENTIVAKRGHEREGVIGKFVRVKEYSIAAMHRAIPEPESALLSGILLGTKKALGKKKEEEFITTGIIHIVALSGYNVTIIAEALLKVLNRFSKRLAYGLGTLSILAFALTTGGGATVVRATIMALIALWSKALQMRFSVLWSVLCAAFIMVFHNPKVLLYDASFQLSFLATIGIIYFAPIVIQYLRILPEKWGIRDLVGVTLGVQVFVLPYLLHRMGVLSLVSLPANMCVLPLVPPAMLFGFLAAVLSFVGDIVAFPFSFTAYLLLRGILGCSSVFASVPYAAITVQQFPLWAVVGLYALFIVLIARKIDDRGICR